MRITLLGSCRQHSLERHYALTNIQENLTYPHYTKEIIQAIEFCKGISSVPHELTRWLFRSGILAKQTLSPFSFSEQFKQTDYFVLEIASRIQYKYKGHYAHHILTEADYGFMDRENIEVSLLTDEEIEEDLIRIKTLLDPKPFMVVSHIYSYKRGKRYELVELLRNLCKKHSIAFFDPIEELGELATDESIFEKESLLAHYSQKGHAIIGELYSKRIGH